MTTVEALPSERPIHGQMVLLPTPPPGGFMAADLTRLLRLRADGRLPRQGQG